MTSSISSFTDWPAIRSGANCSGERLLLEGFMARSLRSTALLTPGAPVRWPAAQQLGALARLHSTEMGSLRSPYTWTAPMPTASGSYGDSSSCTRTPRATAKRAEAFIHWRAREEGSRETRTAC